MKNLLQLLIVSPFIFLNTVSADSVTGDKTLQNDVEAVSNTYVAETKNDNSPYVVNVVKEAGQTKMQGDGTAAPSNETPEPSIEPENKTEQEAIATDAVVDLNQKLADTTEGETTGSPK